MQNKELQAETKADSDMTRPEKSCLVVSYGFSVQFFKGCLIIDLIQNSTLNQI